MSRPYSSFRRSLGEPTGPRGPYKPKSDGEAMTKQRHRVERPRPNRAQAQPEPPKSLYTMDEAERRALIRMPRLAFLDPARRFAWEKIR